MLALKAEHISKVYRLGQLNTRSAIESVLNTFRRNGKVIGENDRTTDAESKFVYALRDIDFEVPQGQVLGIIGKNGAGKSTLLKILSRITAPTEGLVKIKGRLASLLESRSTMISWSPQDLGLYCCATFMEMRHEADAIPLSSQGWGLQVR